MKLYLLLLAILGVSNGYKILGVFPLNGRSHMVMFESLMKGLALKGHEVDVYSPFPLKTPIPGYTDYPIIGLSPDTVNSLPMEFILQSFTNTFQLIDFVFEEMGTKLCKNFLNTTLAESLKHTNKTYDLLVTEIFGTDCMVAFGHHFKIPVVSMMSSVNLPWASNRIGNLDNPSYIPNYFMPYSTKMNLFQKIYNMLTLQYFNFKHDIATAKSNEYVKEFFGPDTPDLRKMIYNTSLIFANSHLSMHIARPTVPNFIEVGGIHILQKPQGLPKHLDEAIDVGTKYNGVIYFSMGSMIMTETMEIKKLQGIFNALSKLPYKVIWKANKDKIPKEITIPSNIGFYTWLPQIDMLCHPNVKLFISHGGLMGSQESIYCGVPVLGIPLFADQRLNLNQLANLGMSLLVEYEDISEETISNAAKSLLVDNKYADSAQRISKLFKDRPLTAMETAVYWVEYVIRYHGAPHLRIEGANIPLYQYCLLDVALTFLVFVSIFIYCCVFIKRKLLSLFKTKKTKSE